MQMRMHPETRTVQRFLQKYGKTLYTPAVTDMRMGPWSTVKREILGIGRRVIDAF